MGIVNVSLTDLTESTVIQPWLVKQPDPGAFEAFVNQYVMRALDWAQKKSVNFNNVGTMTNVLKCTDGIRTKEEFCVRLIYSFGYALSAELQSEFAAKVMKIISK